MSETTTSTALEVLDRATGEILDVREAADEQLVGFCANLEQLREALALEEGHVKDEMLARLDRKAKWTHRVRLPETGAEYEIKAPSPSAGTTSWDPIELELALEELVDADTIDAEGAAGALRREVHVVFEVGVGQDPEKIVAEALADQRVKTAETKRTPQTAGIKAIAKVPGAEEVLERAKLHNPPGPRRVTVKRKEAR